MTGRLPPPPDPMGDFEDDVPILRMIVADLAMCDPLDFEMICTLCQVYVLGDSTHKESCPYQRAVNHRNRHATTPGAKR